MKDLLRKFGFTECWCVDFEYASTPGSLPVPHTLVRTRGALRQNHPIIRRRIHSSSRRRHTTSVPTSLFVAYYASALNSGCHLALGWALPQPTSWTCSRNFAG